mmetsp:Transcript_5244/g.12461  ORF Transcript_5244/g.12461 Transcript_5244/m.12461 type:complete len:295 (-) Transcript_5244:1151-2035(-)
MFTRSNSRGTFSGACFGFRDRSSHIPILSRTMHVARPRRSLRSKATTFSASSVVCTTRWSSALHAVEIATSYFPSMVPRSPSRPWNPVMLPFFASFSTARIKPLRPWELFLSRRPSSAFARRLATSDFLFSNILLISARRFCAWDSFASFSASNCLHCCISVALIAAFSLASLAIARNSSTCASAFEDCSRMQLASVCAITRGSLSLLSFSCRGCNSTSMSSFSFRSAVVCTATAASCSSRTACCFSCLCNASCSCNSIPGTLASSSLLLACSSFLLLIVSALSLSIFWSWALV